MLISGLLVGIAVWDYKLRHPLPPDPVAGRKLPNRQANIFVWNDTGKPLIIFIQSKPPIKSSYYGTGFAIESGSETGYFYDFNQTFETLNLCYRYYEEPAAHSKDLRLLIDRAGIWQIRIQADGTVTSECKIPKDFTEVCITVRNRTGKMTNVYIKSDPPLAAKTYKEPFALDPNYETWYWIDTGESYRFMNLMYQIAGEDERTVVLPSLLSVGIEYKYELMPDGSTTLKVVPEADLDGLRENRRREARKP